MIDDIENNEIKEIYCTKLDRINRNIAETISFINRLECLGVKLFTIEEEIDITRPERELSVLIKALFAHYEQKTISSRTIDGIEGGFKRGKYSIGRLPYGFIRNENSELIFDPKKKDIVFAIIDEYINTHLSINQLTIKYGLTSNAPLIYNIFTNEVYRGYKTYRGKKYKVTSDIYVNEHTAKLLKRKMDMYSKKRKHVYLFKKKLFCIKCSSELRCMSAYKKEDVYLYYRCTNSECLHHMKAVNEVVIVQKLNKRLNEIYYENINEILKKNDDKIIEDKLKSVKSKVKKIQRKNNRIMDLYLDFSISIEEYTKRKKGLDIELEKELSLMNDLISGYDYSKYLKSLVIFEHMEEYYINLETQIIKKK